MLKDERTRTFTDKAIRKIKMRFCLKVAHIVHAILAIRMSSAVFSAITGPTLASSL